MRSPAKDDEQREYLHRGAKKRIDKPWRVCWQWRPRRVFTLLGSPLGDRWFATEDQAIAYMEKLKRAYSYYMGGPERFWIEGPTDAKT